MRSRPAAIIKEEPPADSGLLHDQMVRKLRQLLLSGELAAGSRIPEAELCARFSVSRTPLREALKVLATEGFIELRPNRGAIVSPINPAEVGHIFEMKGGLERQIGLLSPARATAEDRAHIEKVHAALGALIAHRDPVSYTALNQEFHRSLAAATKNPLLIQTYDNLQKRILRLRFAINENPARIDASFRDHEAIMTAFRAGARLDLAERLEQHNRVTGDAISAALQNSPATDGI
jgi:DNA-binding GntR family transcriptional regulator